MMRFNLSRCPRWEAAWKRGSRFALSSGLWFAIGLMTGQSPGAAQAPAGKIQIRKEGALPAELQYWFVSRTGSASKPKALPVASPNGVITLEAPADDLRAGSALYLLDVRQGKLAHLPLNLPKTGGPPAEKALGPNLLQNSDFARNGEHWALEQNHPPAGSAMRPINAANSPPGASGKAMRFDITALGKENWHIQFYQTGLDLQEGEAYTLTFWARADRNRPFAVHANVNAEDGHGIGLTADQIPLTTAWRRYRYIFTATRTLAERNRLTFLLGDALGTVELMEPALQKGRAEEPGGANLLQNGDFTRGAEHWTAQSDPAPARATMQWLNATDAPADTSGKVIRFEIGALGKENWHIQFYQTGLDLQEGEAYTLTFWARADRDRTLSLSAGLDRPDWHPLGLDGRLRLREQWERFAVTFTATRTQKDHGRLALLLGEAVGTVELAGMVLQRNGGAPQVSPANVLPVSANDFTFAQRVEIPITYRGRRVQSAQVRLENGKNAPMTYALRPADAGVARFEDVPLNTRLQITVTCGNQEASFERTVASDTPGKVVEIALPEAWTEVKTISGAPSAVHPLIGVWQSRAGAKTSGLRFTFNADGTGSIRPITSHVQPESPPRSPVVNAFRWHLAEGKNRLALGSKVYTWIIQETGEGKMLRLTDRGGKTHLLYRHGE